MKTEFRDIVGFLNSFCVFEFIDFNILKTPKKHAQKNETTVEMKALFVPALICLKVFPVGQENVAFGIEEVYESPINQTRGEVPRHSVRSQKFI